jgi:hypothetical protein
MAQKKLSKILMLFATILISLNCFAQQPSIIAKVKQTNYVEIHFLKGKQPDVYKTKRAIDLTYLKDLILNARNNSSLRCDTTGTIIYFKNKVELAKVYFSSRGTGSKYNRTNAVAFSSNNGDVVSALNYGTGMLVDEVFYEFQKDKKD